MSSLEGFYERSRNEWGYQYYLKEGDQSEYVKFRSCMALTAGFKRSIYPEDISPLRTNQSKIIFDNLYYKGWSKLSDNIFSKLSNSSLNQIREYTSLDINQAEKSGFYRNKSVPLSFAGLLKHIISKDLLRAIKLYLNTNRPFIYEPTILHSKAALRENLSSQELSDKAFSFHRDIDNLRHIKLFVNLTSANRGNHQFIEGSHHTNNRDVCNDWPERTDPLKFHDLFRPNSLYESHLWTGRQDEDALINIYGREKIINIPTTEGFCWIEDTYGLHRGNPPRDKSRFIASYLIGQFAVRY